MLINQNQVKQFKLVTGDDIICEVVNDENESDLYIRNAYKIVSIEQDNKYYTVFRPFMMFQETPTQIMMVRTNQIVAAGIPLEQLYTQYVSAVRNFNEQEYEDEYMSDPMSDEEVDEFFDYDDDEGPVFH